MARADTRAGATVQAAQRGRGGGARARRRATVAVSFHLIRRQESGRTLHDARRAKGGTARSQRRRHPHRAHRAAAWHRSKAEKKVSSARDARTDTPGHHSPSADQRCQAQTREGERGPHNTASPPPEPRHGTRLPARTTPARPVPRARPVFFFFWFHACRLACGLAGRVQLTDHAHAEQTVPCRMRTAPGPERAQRHLQSRRGHPSPSALRALSSAALRAEWASHVLECASCA